MAMGVRAGVPDLIFILPNGKTLWLELKLAKGTLSVPQTKFATILSRLHHSYLLIQADSIEEVVNYLAPALAKICHPE